MTHSKQGSLSISIVTPNFNGADYLEHALRSVVSQDFPRLQYVVADGASSDGSRLIIEQFRNSIDTIISEPDTGHADALNKGFAKTDGEIMGWINSDDVLHPDCLARVARVFGAYPDVDWITGRPTAMNAAGEIQHIGDARPWSRLRFLSGDHGWIQQESTFWRRSLWDRAGGYLDDSLSLANDFELWARFFRHAHLYSVDSMLGCFRVRPGQRSVDQWAQYTQEVDQVLRRELNMLEDTWREAYGSVLPHTPKTLTDAQKLELDPQLRAFDPPIIRDHDLRRHTPLGSGGSRFNPAFKAPEPISDLSAFKDKHAGERCFIMGNGPSLNETDLSLLEDETVFACNAAFLLFDRINWRPTYYTCVDSQVLPDRAQDIDAMLVSHPNMVGFFPAELQEHGGARSRFAARSHIQDGPNRYFFNEEAGSLDHLPWSLFSTDVERAVIQPYTVAVTMLQLAAYMGFSEIHLIGCDMRYTVPDDAVRGDGKSPGDIRLRSTSSDTNHFDPDYFGPGRKWHLPQVSKMREHFQIAGEALSRLGVRVKNATVGGDLDVFERATLEEIVAEPRKRRPRRKTLRPHLPSNARKHRRIHTFIDRFVRLTKNNMSILAGLGVLVVLAIALGLAAPQWAVWIALGVLTIGLGGAIGAVALKTRRIVLHLAEQLRFAQNSGARAEMAHQRAELELQSIRYELDQLRERDAKSNSDEQKST